MKKKPARTKVDWEKYFDKVNSQCPGWQVHIVARDVGYHKNLSTKKNAIWLYLRRNYDLRTIFVKKFGDDIIVVRIRR